MSPSDLLLSKDWSWPEFDEALKTADGAAIEAVLELRSHPDEEVRLDLAHTLPALARGEDPTDEMLRAAIELSSDQGDDVRDWACFALAEQWREIDTPDLRDALAARLDDSHVDTRCEALVGLAYRNDPRALPAVREALSRPSDDIWRMELVAAGALSTPDLHDLVMLHQMGWDNDDTADLARRLTDPAGPGDDILDAAAELYRRRAHGEPDGDSIRGWHVMNAMLDIAPQRAPEFLELVASRLEGDAPAEIQLRTHSVLAQLATEPRQRPQVDL
jgi:hypothetical protein